MFASILALLGGAAFTFGIFIYFAQYPTNGILMATWFVFILALASYQISDFLTPFIIKILP